MTVAIKFKNFIAVLLKSFSIYNCIHKKEEKINFEQMTVIFIINTSLAQRQSSVHNFRTDTVDLFNSKNDLQFTKEYLQEIRKKEYMKNQPNFYIV